MARKLIVHAISGNEEKWVKQWCESVLKANPYKVVVNLTQYDDNSEALFKECISEDKLIFMKFPWQGSFSEARNHCIDAFPKDADYAFQIDLDEVITNESYSVLEAVLNSNEDYVHLVTIYNALNETKMAAHLYYPRLVPLHYKGKSLLPDLHFEAAVHNQLIIDDTIPVVRSAIGLYHYGYALSPEEMKKKHDRSEKLIRDQIAVNKDDFFAWLNLAQLLRAKQSYPATEEAARKVLRIIEPKISSGNNKFQHARLMALDQLSTALVAQGKFKEAIPYVEIALTIKPDYMDSIMCAANIYMELHDFDKAEYWFKRYLFIRSKYDELKDNTNLILNHLNSSFIALYSLGRIKQIQNKPKEAAQYFKKSYEDEPRFRDVFIRYIDMLRHIDEEKKAFEEINDFMVKHSEMAYMVYEYLAAIALEQGNIELMKFNFYQALFINTPDDPAITQYLRQRWDSIHSLFGDVALNFFDTSGATAKTAARGV